MSSRGSGWVFMFALAQTFSTYAALGILKKTCPVPSSALPPLCSTFLTGESENETGTNTPLLGRKYVLATGSFNKTDLAVSWQDTETGRSHRRLSFFRGVSWTFSEVPRWQSFGVFPWYSCKALGLSHSVFIGSLWRLLWEQLRCWSHSTKPARSP